LCWAANPLHGGRIVISRRLFLCLMVLTMTVGLAHATILYDSHFNYMCVDADGYGFGAAGNYPTALPAFDPSLGTLLAIRIQVVGWDQFDVNVINNNELYGLDVTASLSGSWHVTGPGGVDWTFTHPAYSETVPLGPNLSDFSGTNAHRFTMVRPSGGLVPDNGSGVTYIDPSGFAYFTTPGGPGDLPDAFSVSNNSTQGSVLGDSSAYNPDWYTDGNPDLARGGYWASGATVSMQYTYETPDPPGPTTPEPCTLALLSIGTIGMGLRARRKKTQPAA
jgi:hypothetical protein